MPNFGCDEHERAIRRPRKAPDKPYEMVFDMIGHKLCDKLLTSNQSIECRSRGCDEPCGGLRGSSVSYLVANQRTFSRTPAFSPSRESALDNR
jgi:hypothetical protein